MEVWDPTRGARCHDIAVYNVLPSYLPRHFSGGLCNGLDTVQMVEPVHVMIDVRLDARDVEHASTPARVSGAPSQLSHFSWGPERS